MSLSNGQASKPFYLRPRFIIMVLLLIASAIAIPVMADESLHMAAPSIPVDPAVSEAVRTFLVYNRIEAFDTAAITYWETNGSGLYYVSVIGLMTDEKETWNLMDDALWVGTVVIDMNNPANNRYYVP